jgi:hypothetical protein
MNFPKWKREDAQASQGPLFLSSLTRMRFQLVSLYGQESDQGNPDRIGSDSCDFADPFSDELAGVSGMNRIDVATHSKR